jgi:hypothetical protein
MRHFNQLLVSAGLLALAAPAWADPREVFSDTHMLRPTRDNLTLTNIPGLSCAVTNPHQQSIALGDPRGNLRQPFTVPPRRAYVLTDISYLVGNVNQPFVTLFVAAQNGTKSTFPLLVVPSNPAAQLVNTVGLSAGGQSSFTSGVKFAPGENICMQFDQTVTNNGGVLLTITAHGYLTDVEG